MVLARRERKPSWEVHRIVDRFVRSEIRAAEAAGKAVDVQRILVDLVEQLLPQRLNDCEYMHTHVVPNIT